ncbi:hypothetical protein TWF506_000858 [Arthrobotrys conoides]|uniref:Uncharacterized protein n=1 Tax=Arthrobotrys conoides TaxID=74498 RepID=A0AAN8RQV6_9PEZI
MMASRSLLRRARPDACMYRPPMQLYRIALPYRPAITLQRQCSTRTTSSNSASPPSQKLEMSNPLYRDLIKSIKNPFVRDSIHRLVQGEAVFDESISQDLHGTGNSLYFRVPELPPKMKGHSHDPEGIPLPPNTFRVSSTEELRSILGRILEYRARSLEDEENADYIRDRGDNGWYDNLNTSAEAAVENIKDEKKKEDTPQAESKKPESPPWESKIPDMPDWKPSESFEAFKGKLNQYFKTGSELVTNLPPGVSMTSVLEAMEQKVRKSRELLEKRKSGQDTAKTLNIDYEARKLRQGRRSHGFDNPRSMWGHREFLEHLSEARRKKESGDPESLGREEIKADEGLSHSSKPEPSVPPSKSNKFLEDAEIRVYSQVYPPWTTPASKDPKAAKLDDPSLLFEKGIRQARNTLSNIISMMPKAPESQATSSPNQEDKPLEKSQTPGTDTVEPVTERITLMDILNGTASSSPEKTEHKTDNPTAPVPLPEKPDSSEPPVNGRDSPPSAKVSSESTAGLLEAIATLSEKLSQANKRILELEAPSAGVPHFQKFTEYMDGALEAQYLNTRDYLEEEVLSGMRGVATRLESLEKTMQKILENQEAAATTAKSKDGACIYSTEGGESGEEPKVPVTVKLDEMDKANLQEVVDAAVKTAVTEIVAGIQDQNKEGQEALIVAIGEQVEGVINDCDLIESIVHEILATEGISKRLDLQCKIIVGQVLEMLGKDENGDLQRIVDAAVKTGTKDLEETVKSRLGDVQLKLFGMDRILRGM